MAYEQSTTHAEYETTYINPKSIQEIKKEFDKGALLYSDALNAWPQVVTIDTLGELNPVLHYREYFESKHARWVQKQVEDTTDNKENLEPLALKAQQEFDLIMQLSNAEQIAAFNALVDAFNIALPDIKRQRDVNKVTEFTQKARDLVGFKKETSDAAVAMNKRIMIDYFSNGEFNLHKDASNIWPRCHTTEDFLEQLNTLKEVPGYQEYFQHKYDLELQQIKEEDRQSCSEEEIQENKKRYDAELQAIMKLSDPDKVKEFDALVCEFNAALSEIKAEKDFDKFQEFIKRANVIIRTKRKQNDHI